MKFCSQCGAPVILRIPTGDNLLRYVCASCDTIHYQNPKIVAGCIPEWEGRILLCRRAIEPRYGLWTLPAGFMENSESAVTAAAREALRELIERSTRVYGEFHNTTLVLRNDLAFAAFSLGLIDEAIAAYEELLRVREEHSGPTDPQTMTVRGNLAELYLQAGRLDLAEEYARTCHAHHVATSGPYSPNAQAVGITLANVLLLTNRPAEAVPIAETIVVGRKRVAGVAAPATLRALDQLATAYANANRLEDARSTYVEVAAATLDPLVPDAHVNALASIGLLSYRLDDQDEARRRFDELVAFLEHAPRPWVEPISSKALGRARAFYAKVDDGAAVSHVDALLATAKAPAESTK